MTDRTTTSVRPNRGDDVEAAGHGSADCPERIEDVEPITFSSLGRLFAVPLLIIGMIVGGAVLVVLLFAGPASPEQRSVESLLRSLEAGSGERNMGMLLTKEKEHWQTALELSLRLEEQDADAGLTPAERQTVAVRLGTMVRTEIDKRIQRARAGVPPPQQRADHSKHFEFMVRALGRTGRPEAVDSLLAVVQSGQEPYVTAALREFGELHSLPESRRAIGPIVRILETSDRAETQLVACTVLSVLGRPDDRNVIDALIATRLAGAGEVAWTAALALARLGSDAGKSTLYDLLDRSFLESGQRYRVVDSSGRVLRYALPPQRVDELLMAAMDAASNLDDTEVWKMISQLTTDPSPAVRGHAKTAIKARAG